MFRQVIIAVVAVAFILLSASSSYAQSKTKDITGLSALLGGGVMIGVSTIGAWECRRESYLGLDCYADEGKVVDFDQVNKGMFWGGIAVVGVGTVLLLIPEPVRPNVTVNGDKIAISKSLDW